MPQVVIENPVLNSPFREPTRHFRFAKEVITNEIADGRRISSYFVPIAKPRGKAKGGPNRIGTARTDDRLHENDEINRNRERREPRRGWAVENGVMSSPCGRMLA